MAGVLVAEGAVVACSCKYLSQGSRCQARARRRVTAIAELLVAVGIRWPLTATAPAIGQRLLARCQLAGGRIDARRGDGGADTMSTAMFTRR